MTFSSNRAGSWDLYQATADGADEGEVLLARQHEQWLGSWSRDGKFLAYYEVHPETARDIWVYPAEKGRDPIRFLATPANERSPQFSPDAHWLAYVSNESGRDEVYLMPFPGGGRRWTISTDGGAEAVWSHDGRSLFYRQGNRMLEVELDFGPPLSAARPHVIFEGSYKREVAGNPAWDLSQDGRRFLMMKRSDAWAPTRLHVVLNWFTELDKLVLTERSR